jgi:hypothetical protein
MLSSHTPPTMANVPRKTGKVGDSPRTTMAMKVAQMGFADEMVTERFNPIFVIPIRWEIRPIPGPVMPMAANQRSGIKVVS